MADSTSMACSSATSNEHNSNSSRQAWWRKSVVRRYATSIQKDYDHITDSSPLLNNAAHHSLPVFSRSEIVTGDILGSGGFSQVYEIVGFNLSPEVTARCTPDQQAMRIQYSAAEPSRRFALKILKQRLVQSPKDFCRAATDLALEGAYMTVLQHRNILNIRGLPIDGVSSWKKNGNHDDFFLILDRLDETIGDKIGRWKESGTSPCTELVSDYSLQLAQALEFLHSKRIVFRDLKPHNVGISPDGVVQLFDFGLCRELPLSTTCNLNEVFEMSGVGTRRYMAPESIATDDKVAQGYNVKVDVYAWAIVTWEMLTICKPYAGFGTEEHLTAVVEKGERPILRLQWPEWLRQALEHAWCTDVTDRWTMARVVSHVTASMKHVDLVPVSPVGVDHFTSFSISDLLTLPFLPTLSVTSRQTSTLADVSSGTESTQSSIPDECDDEASRILS